MASVGGFIWFTEVDGNRIGRFDPAAGDIQLSITEFTLPTAASKPTSISAGPARSAPSGIAAGRDGAVWFTEAGSNQIGRITTAGAVTNEFPVATPDSGASRLGEITAGPDSALWFVDSGLDHVGRISTSGTTTRFPAPAGSGLEGIAPGSDGALWLTEGRAGKIARIGTDGSVAQYSLPTGGAGPAGITAGPDGALWFRVPTCSSCARPPAASRLRVACACADRAGPRTACRS